jgi:hypothetical protein
MDLPRRVHSGHGEVVSVPGLTIDSIMRGSGEEKVDGETIMRHALAVNIAAVPE